MKHELEKLMYAIFLKEQDAEDDEEVWDTDQILDELRSIRKVIERIVDNN